MSSTTGNVTGVYDMAGGAYEYVMGVLKTEDGTGLTYSYSYSGFTASTLPLGSKYVDAYTYGTTKNEIAAYNRRRLGDATGETNGWYSDYATFPYSSVSFFARGGDSSSSGVGVFDFYSGAGDPYANYSFRSTLATS